MGLLVLPKRCITTDHKQFYATVLNNVTLQPKMYVYSWMSIQTFLITTQLVVPSKIIPARVFPFKVHAILREGRLLGNIIIKTSVFIYHPRPHGIFRVATPSTNPTSPKRGCGLTPPSERSVLTKKVAGNDILTS